MGPGRAVCPGEAVRPGWGGGSVNWRRRSGFYSCGPEIVTIKQADCQMRSGFFSCGPEIVTIKQADSQMTAGRGGRPGGDGRSTEGLICMHIGATNERGTLGREGMYGTWGGACMGGGGG